MAFRWRMREWVWGECQGRVKGSDCGVGQLRIRDKVLGGGCGLMGRVRTGERAGREEGGCGFGDVKWGVGQLRIGEL